MLRHIAWRIDGNKLAEFVVKVSCDPVYCPLAWNSEGREQENISYNALTGQDWPRFGTIMLDLGYLLQQSFAANTELKTTVSALLHRCERLSNIDWFRRLG